MDQPSDPKTIFDAIVADMELRKATRRQAIVADLELQQAADAAAIMAKARELRHILRS